MKIVQKMLSITELYMLLEEKLSMGFDNPTSTETHSSLSARKESHLRRDKFDRVCMNGMTSTPP